MNFRSKLWRWAGDLGPRALAEKTMRGILPRADVVIGNEEDFSDVFGMRAGQTDVNRGYLEVDWYPDVARQVAGEFPQLAHVAITLRESISASENNWGAMLYDVGADKVVFAPKRDGRYQPYQITHIVNRVGAGDSFSAGLISCLLKGKSPEEALAFATAASCLKHTIPRDFNLVSEEEVMRLVNGEGSGRVQR